MRVVSRAPDVPPTRAPRRALAAGGRGRARALLPLAAALLLGPAEARSEAPASRDEATAIPGTRAEARRAGRRDPYARFSDGPRRVPRRRGASLRRSRALGVGSTAELRGLLGGPLPARIRAAIPGGGLRKPLHWPVDGGRFGRGFGYVRRTIPDLRHDGIDVVAPRDTVVRAIAPGLVVYSDNGLRGFGNCVAIAHGDGLVSLYAHLERATVQPGWRARRGERIGFVGDTGIARGPHLHMELRKDGRLVDPMRWLTAPRDADPEGVDRGPDGRIAALGGRALDDPATTLAWLREGLPANVGELLDGRRFSTWLWPLRGGRPGAVFGDGHRGLDAVGEAGTPVRAAADGLVVFTGPGLPGVGTAVVLAHPTGDLTLYGHVDEIAVRPGEAVQRGNWIARLAPGPDPHVHFAVYRAGHPVDPGRAIRRP